MDALTFWWNNGGPRELLMLGVLMLGWLGYCAAIGRVLGVV